MFDNAAAEFDDCCRVTKLPDPAQGFNQSVSLLDRFVLHRAGLRDARFSGDILRWAWHWANDPSADGLTTRVESKPGDGGENGSF